MAKNRGFEGKSVVADKVKVLGASGLRYDAGDTGGGQVPGDGVWVEVVIRGRTGAVTHDPQKGGYAREVEVHASAQHSTVTVMDEAPPEMEGQEQIEGLSASGNVVAIAGEPDAGTEPGED